MENASIEKRLVKVSVATWICTLITLVIQLISVPVCLHYWGKNTYGTWLAVLAAFTIMRTIDYGYTLYVGNKINILYHSDDHALRLSLASAVWGIIILGILQILFLIALYASNSMHLIMGHGESQSYSRDIFLSLLIMSVCWVGSASYIGIVHRILNPLGMLYQSTWMMMWLQVAQFIAILFAAILHFTILQTSILYAITQVAFYISSAVYVKRIVPTYFPWWTNSSVKVGIRDIIGSIPQTFGWMMTQIGVSALILLISSFLGPAAVPAFTTLRTISNLWTTLINSFTQPMIPEAVRFHTKGEWQKLISVNQVHGVLMSAAVNLSLLIVYPFINIVFTVWTGDHLHFDKPLLSLLLAAIAVSGMSALMGTFLAGINNFGFIIISSSLRGGFVLALSWVLLPKYGTLGLGLAICIAETLVLIITNIWFFKLVVSKIGGKITLGYFGWSWLSLVCVIAYLLMQCMSLNTLNPMYWLALIVTIISTVLAWRDLDPAIKNRFKALIKQKTGRI